MFRRLTSVAAAAVAMASFFTVTAAPAQADGNNVTIAIQYDSASLPNTTGTYQVNGAGLVGSVTGIVDGEIIDASSCAVDVSSLDAFLAGQTPAVVGNCADAGSVAATLTPYVDSEGGVVTNGSLEASILKWEVRGNCRGRWFLGIPVYVECELEVSIGNN